MSSPLLIRTLNRSRPALGDATRLVPDQPKPAAKATAFQLPKCYQSVDTYIADELDCDVVSITVGTGDSQKSFNVHQTPLQ